MIAALFPRSLKQLLLLGMGGGLVYRGVTSHCGLYQALDLNTEKASAHRGKSTRSIWLPDSD